MSISFSVHRIWCGARNVAHQQCTNIYGCSFARCSGARINLIADLELEVELRRLVAVISLKRPKSLPSSSRSWDCGG